MERERDRQTNGFLKRPFLVLEPINQVKLRSPAIVKISLCRTLYPTHYSELSSM